MLTHFSIQMQISACQIDYGARETTPLPLSSVSLQPRAVNVKAGIVKSHREPLCKLFLLVNSLAVLALIWGVGGRHALQEHRIKDEPLQVSR